MNKQIQQLANIWANRRAEDEKLGIVYTFSEPALEQFAQLIVQECVHLFGVTRTEPSLEKFILDRLGVHQ